MIQAADFFFFFFFFQHHGQRNGADSPGEQTEKVEQGANPCRTHGCLHRLLFGREHVCMPYFSLFTSHHSRSCVPGRKKKQQERRQRRRGQRAAHGGGKLWNSLCAAAAAAPAVCLPHAHTHTHARTHTHSLFTPRKSPVPCV